MSNKAAAGSGSIRKKTITKNGKEHTYWEARYTLGRDPGAGKQVQKTITGKTQKEVSQKLKSVTVSIDNGTYMEPSKMTVGEWLDIWADEYLCNVKPRTVDSYLTTINHRIKPGLGATRLDQLTPHTIQAFYNSLGEDIDKKGALCPKSVKNVHGILHRALKQAVLNGYTRFNPTEACVLPKIIKKEITPLDDDTIYLFLKAIKGHKYEDLFITALFTGMREGEILGLQENCVDLLQGKLIVNKQLQKVRGSRGEYALYPTKNDKSRTIALSNFVLTALRRAHRRKLENKLALGPAWEDSGFVFTDELGHHLKHQTVYLEFKKIVTEIGAPNARFHDLRHSFAVSSIRAGDDIKTVQEHLGHATAAFTLDVYGHVTDQMHKESAVCMDRFIENVLTG